MRSLAFILVFATILALGRSDVTKFLERHFLTPDLQRMCRHQGGELADLALKRSIPAITDCISLHLNITEINEEVRKIADGKDYVLIFAKFCANTTEVFKCINDDVKDLVQTCFNETQGLVINTVWEIFNRAINHTCTDTVIDYLTDRVVPCLAILEMKHPKCVETRMERDKRLEFPYLYYEFKENECSYLDVELKCAAKILKLCDKPERYKIIDDFFETIRDPIPCNFENSTTDIQFTLDD